MSSAIVPIPKTDVTVRLATADDLPFVDSLQKMHGDRVGFLRMKALEGKLRAEQILIACQVPPVPSLAEGGTAGGGTGGTPVGYVIAQDRYLKREDCGIVYQMNVMPGRQRGFVGATLLKAVFDRAAYGCRLFCCWCAQDIEANRFWEAMGFVPLAYRAGSEKKRRVHIFWQKRIRHGDCETPWWFPSQTNAGALGADRLVLPIPQDRHWSDEMPVMVVPTEPRALASGEPLPHGRGSRARISSTKPVAAVKRTHVSARGGLFFARPAPVVEDKAPEKKPRGKKPKLKNDPKLVAAARELRDRWLEHVNSGQALLESSGKYDLTRALGQSRQKSPSPLLLPAAA
jgi:hypothetical protein